MSRQNIRFSSYHKFYIYLYRNLILGIINIRKKWDLKKVIITNIRFISFFLQIFYIRNKNRYNTCIFIPDGSDTF